MLHISYRAHVSRLGPMCCGNTQCTSFCRGGARGSQQFNCRLGQLFTISFRERYTSFDETLSAFSRHTDIRDARRGRQPTIFENVGLGQIFGFSWVVVPSCGDEETFWRYEDNMAEILGEIPGSQPEARGIQSKGLRSWKHMWLHDPWGRRALPRESSDLGSGCSFGVGIWAPYQHFSTWWFEIELRIANVDHSIPFGSGSANGLCGQWRPHSNHFALHLCRYERFIRKRRGGARWRNHVLLPDRVDGRLAFYCQGWILVTYIFEHFQASQCEEWPEGDLSPMPSWPKRLGVGKLRGRHSRMVAFWKYIGSLWGGAWVADAADGSQQHTKVLHLGHLSRVASGGWKALHGDSLRFTCDVCYLRCCRCDRQEDWCSKLRFFCLVQGHQKQTVHPQTFQRYAWVAANIELSCWRMEQGHDNNDNYEVFSCKMPGEWKHCSGWSVVVDSLQSCETYEYFSQGLV